MYFNIAKEILQLSLRTTEGNVTILCCERSEGIFFTPRDDTESHHVVTMPNVKK